MLIRLRSLFLENWQAKLVTLVIATAAYFSIRSQLPQAPTTPPVPGTGPTLPTRPAVESGFDDTLLNPPLPLPIPGADSDE